MNTLWDRTRPLCRKIPQWVTQLAVNYDFLFIRRCFAFYIDIIILLVFSISIAYLNLSADVDVISPQLSSIILTSYFLISRFISNGTTIGMRVFRLHFVFRTPYFMRVRLLYRFLLSIFMFILSFDFLSVIAYLLPFNFRIFNLTLLTIGIAVAIPTYSFLMILFSHGATSLVDRISKCRVSSRSSSSEGAFIKDRRVFIRKHTGGFLLLTSLICFLLLILNWRFELSEIFSDKTFSTMLANPIKKVGRTLEFQQFSKTGYPVLSVIVTGGDYLIPYLANKRTICLRYWYSFLRINFTIKTCMSVLHPRSKKQGDYIILFFSQTSTNQESRYGGKDNLVHLLLHQIISISSRQLKTKALYWLVTCR